MKEYEKNNPDNLLKISGLEKEEPKEIDSEFYNLIENNFKNPNLQNIILEEIQKRHIGDEEQVQTLFLIALSSLSPNPNERLSVRVAGNTSTGKSNAINSTVSFIPEENVEILTSTTKAILEDDVLEEKSLVVVSELNLFRENGANAQLIETLKALAEGGLHVKKKDLRTNSKTVREEISEQKSIIYSTTDEKADLELGTRQLDITITSDSKQTKAVNDNTLLLASNPFIQEKQKDNWVKVGIRAMNSRVGSYEIILPYANLLSGKINEKDIIDNSNPRSRRDLKRLISLVKSYCRLHYLQRNKIDSEKLILSKPKDFIEVLKIAKGSFDQTYSGLDRRVSEVYNLISKKPSWIDRSNLQKEVGCSVNTLKKYLDELKNQGLIEINIGKNIEFMGLDSQKVFVKLCQNPVKPLLISCQINELEDYLNKNYQEDFDRVKEFYTQKGVKIQGVKMPFNNDSSKNSEIDRVELTPFNSQEVQE